MLAAASVKAPADPDGAAPKVHQCRSRLARKRAPTVIADVALELRFSCPVAQCYRPSKARRDCPKRRKPIII